MANIIEEYEQRLNNLPVVNQQVAAEIKKLEQLVEDQSTSAATQVVRWGFKT
jgi:hypothetical protein